MPTVLQNIGASGVGTSIADYVSRERALRVEEQRRGLETEARVGSLRAQTELTENQLIQARKQQAAENERRPFQLLLDNTKIPEAKEYVTNLANAMGFVAPDGTISVKNAKELQTWLTSDLHKPALSAMKLNHAKKQYDLFKKASEDPEFAKKNNLKPGTEEFQAQFEAAKQGWIAAQAYDSNYQQYLENQATMKLRETQLLEAQRQANKTEKESFTVVKPGETVIDSEGNEVFSVPESDKGKEPKQYTLKPGDTLVSATGEVIKEIPPEVKEKEPKRIVVRPGESVIDSDGKELFKLPKDETASKLYTLKPGDKLVDASGNEKAQNPASAKGPNDYAPDVQIWRNSKTGQSTEVNVRDKTATENAKKAGFEPVGPRAKGYLTQEGKAGAEYATAISESAAKARAQVITLNTMDQLLDRFESGRLAGVGKSIQQWASAFGIPIDTSNLSSKEAFNAITEQLALQSRNQGEGMVLAGQMSDRDVQFLRDMNPQIILSKGGNKLLIKIRKKVAERQSKIPELAKEYRDQNNGVLDQLGFNEYASKKLGGTSIFGIPEGAEIAGTDKQTGLPVYKLNDKLFIPNF